MTINSTAKTNGRSRAKSKSESSPAESAEINAEAQPTNAETSGEADSSEVSKGENKVTDNVVKITARPVQGESSQKDGALQLRHSSLTVSDRPVMPSEIEIVDTISEAGIRPIVASDLQIYASYLNGRPVAASNLKVAEMLPGDRPVFASDLKIVDAGLLPGDRPIMASDPHLLEASLLPGNRPIASNEIDDPTSLMGFID
jgi:hypothetical protein